MTHQVVLSIIVSAVEPRWLVIRQPQGLTQTLDAVRCTCLDSTSSIELCCLHYAGPPQSVGYVNGSCCEGSILEDSAGAPFCCPLPNTTCSDNCCPTDMPVCVYVGEYYGPQVCCALVSR